MDSGKEIVIASSLTTNELAAAFARLVADRWENWDLSPYLAYMVDVCDASILPYLADQFDVEGLRGFEIAENEEQQRELIKRSIALHKYVGTPWAIREACRTVGFPIIILEEGVRDLDGISRPEDWARFRVYVDGNPERQITQEEARKLRLFVNYYKNARSHLVDFGFYHSFADAPVFLNEEENRDRVTVYTLAVRPTNLLINPDGGAKVVQVEGNTPITLKNLVMDWNDGTGEKLYIELSAPDKITLTSDPNKTADREAIIEFLSPDGALVLATLTIQQHNKWRNAYSRAYSNAYNLYPKNYTNSYSRAYSRAYNKEISITLSHEEITINENGDEINLVVYVPAKWIIE